MFGGEAPLARSFFRVPDARTLHPLVDAAPEPRFRDARLRPWRRACRWILFPTSYGRYWQNKEFGLIDAIGGSSTRAGHGVLPGRHRPRELVQQGHPPRRPREDAHGLRKRDRPRRVRLRPAGVRAAPRRRGRSELRRLPRGEHRVPASRLGQPSVQPERRVRHEGVHGRLLRREFLFQQSARLPRQLPDPWKYNHMGVFLGTGEWDICQPREPSALGILHSKGINHWLDDRRWCAHDWNWWREMLPTYLSHVT